LLEPTVIYVRAVLALLASDVAVHGLAHITGDGVLNLLRLGEGIGFEIDAPLAVPPICRLVCELGGLEAAEAYRVFNMGCGFVAVVAPNAAAAAVELLAAHHRGARAIGRVTDSSGLVSLPGLGASVRR
jgi:phosphoribosylformylglycinamidine cyclo-ligase